MCIYNVFLFNLRDLQKNLMRAVQICAVSLLCCTAIHAAASAYMRFLKINIHFLPFDRTCLSLQNRRKSLVKTHKSSRPPHKGQTGAFTSCPVILLEAFFGAVRATARRAARPAAPAKTPPALRQTRCCSQKAGRVRIPAGRCSAFLTE